MLSQGGEVSLESYKESELKFLERKRPEEGNGRKHLVRGTQSCRDTGTLIKSQREASSEGKRRKEAGRGPIIGQPVCRCQGTHGLSPMGNGEPLKYF